MRACANYLCAQNHRCMNPSQCFGGMSPFASTSGWTCPKCGSVWAPATPGCSKCNKDAK